MLWQQYLFHENIVFNYETIPARQKLLPRGWHADYIQIQRGAPATTSHLSEGIDMTDEPPLASGTLIAVRVTPNAGREQVTLDGSRYMIRVTVAPEDGKANKAVTKLLAKALRLPPSRLTLLRGATDRDKVFRVD